MRHGACHVMQCTDRVQSWSCPSRSAAAPKAAREFNASRRLPFPGEKFIIKQTSNRHTTTTPRRTSPPSIASTTRPTSTGHTPTPASFHSFPVQPTSRQNVPHRRPLVRRSCVADRRCSLCRCPLPQISRPLCGQELRPQGLCQLGSSNAGLCVGWWSHKAGGLRENQGASVWV